jgi:hypothetical protein
MEKQKSFISPLAIFTKEKPKRQSKNIFTSNFVTVFWGGLVIFFFAILDYLEEL